jgi:hypothetical protein
MEWIGIEEVGFSLTEIAWTEKTRIGHEFVTKMSKISDAFC